MPRACLANKAGSRWPLMMVAVVLAWCAHFVQSKLDPNHLQVSWFTTESFMLRSKEGVLLSTNFGSEVPLKERALDMPTTTPFPSPDYDYGFVDFSTYPTDGLLCSGLSNFAWGPAWGVSFWIRRKSNSEFDQFILGNMNNTFGGSWSVYMKLGKTTHLVNATATLAFAFRTDNHSTTSAPVFQKFSGLILPIGDPFHHFVMTGDGENVNVYLDNEPVKFGKTAVNKTARGNLVTSANSVYVGGSLTHGSAVKGHLRDVFIYQQFLSSADVDTLYRQSIPPTYPPSPVPTTPPTEAPSKAPTFTNAHLISSYFTNASFGGTVTDLLKDTSGNLRDIAAPTTAKGQYIIIPKSAYNASNQFVNMTFLPANTQAALQVYQFEGWPWGEQWGFSIWFRRVSGSAQSQALMGDMDLGYDGSWGLLINPAADAQTPATLTFAYHTQMINTDGMLTNYFHEIVVPNVHENRWHSFIVTGDGNIANAYLDNVPVYCASSNSYNFPSMGFIANSVNPLYIGGKVNGSSTFIGEMKGITLYSAYLDREDVNILHGRIINTLPTHAPTPAPTAAPTWSHAPTVSPTAAPTHAPSEMPSAPPTVSPTNAPTVGSNDQSTTSSKGSSSSGSGAAIGVSISVIAVAMAGVYYYKYKRNNVPPFSPAASGRGDDIAKFNEGENFHTMNPMVDNIPSPATRAGLPGTASLARSHSLQDL